MASLDASGLGNVRAIKATRVLLSSKDRRFLRVASFLLARQGLDVASATPPTKLLPLLDERAADVVVLDATDSAATTAETAAALAAHYPRIRVIVATENGLVGWGDGLTGIAKWRDLEDLADVVTQAHLGVIPEPSHLEAG